MQGWQVLESYQGAHVSNLSREERLPRGAVVGCLRGVLRKLFGLAQC